MVDRLITLFESTDTNFITNGIGGLPDAISCTVVERRNGEFELSMTYPITGKRYDEILHRRILLAKPNPYSVAQPFRIYYISKPINGVVTINAAHISYDMSGLPVSPFSAGSITSALTTMKNACVVACPFIFWTDKTNTAHIETNVPGSMRSILGGNDDSILAVYGGEFEFDRYTVKLHNNRGSNRGVSIRYGKNLMDLTQEENCSNVYTAVYPYWHNDNEGLFELPGKLVNVPGTFDYTKVLPIDLTSEFKEQPTEAQLRAAASDYISDNNLGTPEVSLTVSFIQLSESEEYKQYALLEEVHLCDTVNVEFPKLNVSATAQVIATTFNVLTNRYETIELGTEKASISNTIADQNKTISTQSIQINNTIDHTALEAAILEATNLITGHSGGYVVLNPAESPSEILILDTPSIETATNVWRWNSGGLGHSSTGYEGPYTLAMTMDGHINGELISAGTITGAMIQAGTIEASDLSVTYKNSVTTQIGSSISSFVSAALASGGSITNKIDSSIADSFDEALGTNGDVTRAISGSITEAFNSALAAGGSVTNKINTSIDNSFDDALSTNGSVTNKINTSIEDSFDDALSANGSVTNKIDSSIADSFDDALADDGSVTNKINTSIDESFEDELSADGDITNAIDNAVTGTINTALDEGGSIRNAMDEANAAQTLILEESFNVGDGILDSLIRKLSAIIGVDPDQSLPEDYDYTVDGRLPIITQQFSDLRQTVDELNTTFLNQVIGGINNIRNSSGLNGVSDDWSYTGSVIAEQNAVAASNTVSGSLFKLNNGTLSQLVPVVKGTTYTLTVKSYRKTSDRCYVRIENGGKNTYVFDEQSSSNKWITYYCTFKALGDEVNINTYTSGNYLYVADFMLIEGDKPSHWTPAPNEIYTTNVKIDRRGINITNDQSSTQTLIDNTQFAVKHNNEVVLTVNKDLTQLKKTEITDELTIGKGKFMPHTDGLNFVLLD